MFSSTYNQKCIIFNICIFNLNELIHLVTIPDLNVSLHKCFFCIIYQLNCINISKTIVIERVFNTAKYFRQYKHL